MSDVKSQAQTPGMTDEEIALRVEHIAQSTKMKFEHIRDLAAMAAKAKLREADALAAAAAREWDAVTTPSTPSSLAVNELGALVGKPPWPNAFDLMSLSEGLEGAARAVSRLAGEWDGLTENTQNIKMTHVCTVVMLAHSACLRYERK